jgi:WD40 repeat protein
VWDEESGKLHRLLDGFGGLSVSALATFLSADGQQVRLVAGSGSSRLRVYDPEAGSMLHALAGHDKSITALACIASSSTAPHHPRLVSTSYDGTVKVWDGETGELLADLGGRQSMRGSVAVWKEHTRGHDRFATAGNDGKVKVWDGEAFTLLHDLDCARAGERLLAFESAEGPARLLVWGDYGLQMWDPEEGRLLHDGINRDSPISRDWHLFESAQGRHLLAIVGRDLSVWDLGEAPAREDEFLRPAHKHG